MSDIDPHELFIGHRLDVESSLTVDPADLTTHGVIVGMTVSGKTGLGIDPLGGGLASGLDEPARLRLGPARRRLGRPERSAVHGGWEER
jgi:hypothetical protein